MPAPLRLAAALPVVTLGAAHAEPLPGIRFDLMPVGCRIHGAYSDGKKVVDEYLGKIAGSHVIRTAEDRPGGRQIRTTRYNDQGYMTRKDWAGGKWETFSPFSCFDRPGRCEYRYRNADGADETYRGEARFRGGKVTVTGGFSGEAPFARTTVVPGPFNLGEAWSDGTTRFRVKRYEGCGLKNAGM